MKKKVFLMLVLFGVLLFIACKSSSPFTLNVLTHDSFAISEGVIEMFEKENNVEVNFILSGDAGSLLNQAILTKTSPVADVLYGVDNTFLSRALEADIFEVYQSSMVQNIPDEFKLDPTNRVLPVDYGDVCINYDKAYFASKNLPVPETLDDLLMPEYSGLLVVENPAVSSPGLAFLMATIVQYGEEGYLDYWQKLKDNAVVVVNDWSTAYYTNFSASSGKGQQPLVVSYGTSPAAEVIFASPRPSDAPTASLVGENACFRQIEFVGILKGTQERALAEKFVDFMLDKPFQEDLPLNMFVFPVNSQALLPEEFILYVQVPEKPASLPSEQIAAKRESWIEAWRKVVFE